jgi:putative spermidine/putrescine transport system substrate-binding protein
LFLVNGKYVAVPVSWVATGILWRPDLVPFEITTWKDLWRPELKQRISLQAMPTLGGASFIIISSLINGGTTQDVEKGFQALRELKPNVKFFFKVSSDVLNQLVSGEIWAAVTIADQAIPFKEEGVSVVIPEEGTTHSMQVFGIPVGSKNYENASKFINYLLSPDAQVEWSRGAGAAPCNMTVELPAEVQENLYETPEVAERIWPVDFLHMGKSMEEWTERWDREFAN